MAADLVTVAIPVLNGGAVLGQTLDAVRAQALDAEVELLVADSGSTDGSAARAEQAGARVIDVAPGEFSHGGTRNLLMEEAAGAHVAFLTQDATPAGDRTGWRGCSTGSRSRTTSRWCSAPTSRDRTRARWCGASCRSSSTGSRRTARRG